MFSIKIFKMNVVFEKRLQNILNAGQVYSLCLQRVRPIFRYLFIYLFIFLDTSQMIGNIFGNKSKEAFKYKYLFFIFLFF